VIVTHYERLGVAPDAETSAIRDAYRRLARVHHPDARGGAASAEMPAINEAYGVLSDPIRRRDYDRGLMGNSSHTAHGDTVASGARPAEPRVNPIGRYTEPPRFPWRFVVALVGVGTVAILVIGAFSSPAPPLPVDNVLQVGSCVTVDESVGEATEVRCDEPYEAVVEALVPFDGRCPTGLESFRDRQGLGRACVRRT
jgi:hypothetical protein